MRCDEVGWDGRRGCAETWVVVAPRPAAHSPPLHHHHHQHQHHHGTMAPSPPPPPPPHRSCRAVSSQPALCPVTTVYLAPTAPCPVHLPTDDRGTAQPRLLLPDGPSPSLALPMSRVVGMSLPSSTRHGVASERCSCASTSPLPFFFLSCSPTHSSAMLCHGRPDQTPASTWEAVCPGADGDAGWLPAISGHVRCISSATW